MTKPQPGIGGARSIVWSSWHFPLIIGGDYRGVGPVWYSVLCFTVIVTGLGFLTAWVRLKSGSVWPAVLAHASHNLFIQSIFDPMTRHTPMTGYVLGEFGAGLALALTVVAWICWRKRGVLAKQ